MTEIGGYIEPGTRPNLPTKGRGLGVVDVTGMVDGQVKARWPAIGDNRGVPEIFGFGTGPKIDKQRVASREAELVALESTEHLTDGGVIAVLRKLQSLSASRKLDDNALLVAYDSLINCRVNRSAVREVERAVDAVGELLAAQKGTSVTALEGYPDTGETLPTDPEKVRCLVNRWMTQIENSGCPLVEVYGTARADVEKIEQNRATTARIDLLLGERLLTREMVDEINLTIRTFHCKGIKEAGMRISSPIGRAEYFTHVFDKADSRDLALTTSDLKKAFDFRLNVGELSVGLALAAIEDYLVKIKKPDFTLDRNAIARIVDYMNNPPRGAEAVRVAYNLRSALYEDSARLGGLEPGSSFIRMAETNNSLSIKLPDGSTIAINDTLYYPTPDAHPLKIALVPDKNKKAGLIVMNDRGMASEGQVLPLHYGRLDLDRLASGNSYADWVTRVLPAIIRMGDSMLKNSWTLIELQTSIGQMGVDSGLVDPVQLKGTRFVIAEKILASIAKTRMTLIEKLTLENILATPVPPYGKPYLHPEGWEYLKKTYRI